MTISLAILEENQGHSGPPLLLVLGGDVNIKHINHNLLLAGMQHARKDTGTICWSKSIPFPAQFTQKHKASPATRLQTQQVSNSCAAQHTDCTCHNLPPQVF